MVAGDTAAAAVAVGAVAAADTLAATPEDVVPVLSWVDETVLWSAAFSWPATRRKTGT